MQSLGVRDGPEQKQGWGGLGSGENRKSYSSERGHLWECVCVGGWAQLISNEKSILKPMTVEMCLTQLGLKETVVLIKSFRAVFPPCLAYASHTKGTHYMFDSHFF